MRCPDCASDNPPDYRFCGMCGTPLRKNEPVAETAGRAPVKRFAPTPAADRTRPAPTSVSGPSFLGLSGDGSSYSGAKSSRDLDYLFEEEHPQRTYWRFALLVIILLAVGGLGWLAYSKNGKAWVAARMRQTPNAAQASQPAGPSEGAPNATGPGSPQAAATSQPTALKPQPPGEEVGPPEKDIPAAEGTGSKAEANQETPAASASDKQVATKSASSAEDGEVPGAKQSAEQADTPSSEAKPAKFNPPPPKAKSVPRPPPVSEDDALVANAEKYLYGRGVPQNCDRALSSLRAAAQRQNPRARSLLGSMYATGHCVPRDLPNAYRWFALASRGNSDNIWVQRNLEMIWREMTPQERQLAIQRSQ